MKHTKTEIIKALIVIKDVCEEVEGCDTCPYGDCMGVCQVLNNDTPNSWIIKQTDEVWRAFE